MPGDVYLIGWQAQGRQATQSQWSLQQLFKALRGVPKDEDLDATEKKEQQKKARPWVRTGFGNCDHYYRNFFKLRINDDGLT